MSDVALPTGESMTIEVVETEEAVVPAANAEVTAVPNSGVAVTGQYASLIQMAIEKDLDVDKLERLIDLQTAAQERQAKADFDFHFAQMQGELPAVTKNAEAYDENKSKHMYNYATLDFIQKLCDPVIHKHGFSYRWRESALENEGKRTTLVISGYGHTDDATFFDTPKINGTQYTNAIQVAGQMSTYGRRYTFVAGFGVNIEGEDKDGVPPGTGTEYANEVLNLQSCGNAQELMLSWRTLYPKIQNNPGALRYLTGIKDDKKKELSRVR